MYYTVMVKWQDAHRAERLSKGTTTTRKVHAIMFPTKDAAYRAAMQACMGIEGIERWWVAPF